MRTLSLTAKERALVASLPAALREGWSVEEEQGIYQDTAERRAFRFQMMRVRDPQLLRFREQVANVKTDAAFVELVQTIDLRRVDNRDIAHIVFALGPDGLTTIVTGILENAKDHEDIELAAAFAALRHGMLQSFQATSRRS